MNAKAVVACGFLWAVVGGSAARAEESGDEAPALAVPAGSTTPAMSRWRSNPNQMERWEAGLDAKLTSLFTRKATDIMSPTMILSAEWNYRLLKSTYFGFSVSGMPQSNSDSDDNGMKRSFTTYYGGVNFAQSVYADGPLRGTVAVTAGKGILYVRTNPPGAAAEIGNTPFYFVEPSAYATFFDYEGLDIGAVLSYRLVMLSKTDRAQNSDLSSVSLGMTFRNRNF